MTVLDASAVLALIQDVPGAELVARSLDGATMSTADLAEVVGKLVDAGLDSRRAVTLLESAGVQIVPLGVEEAVLAGALRELTDGRSLSLGDRCCLAVGLLSSRAKVRRDDAGALVNDGPTTLLLDSAS